MRKRKERKQLGPAFEGSLDLRTMVHFDLNGREVGAFLLQCGSLYQVVFGFDCVGIHPTLSEPEISATLEQLEAGLKDLPQNEILTIHMRIFAGDAKRQEQLSRLSDETGCPPLRFLLCGDRARAQELKREGVRKPSSLTLYCTYTARQDSQAEDLLDKAIGYADRLSKTISGQFADFNNQRFEVMLRSAIPEGFERWERLLSTTMGLKVSPLSATQLWGLLWQRFNRSEPIPIPQLLIVDDEGLQEDINSCIDIKTHLTRDGVPESNKRFVKVGGGYIVALTLIEKPEIVYLHYLYDYLHRDEVRDIEVFCEVSTADPRQSKFAQELLTKQSLHAVDRANTHHNVDVVAQRQMEESVDAQNAIISGARPVYCSHVFLIHRNTPRELEYDARKFESFFARTAWVSREDQLAWLIWLQTLPITCDRMMVFGGRLFDLRQLYLSSEVPGLLSLLRPSPCDIDGVEFITEGGQPVYLDLFDQHRNLGVFGTTRSGKSILVSQVITHGLVRAVPVVALDFPGADGQSTFTDYTAFLEGGYFDLTTAQNNLFELPDVRYLSPEQQRERLKDYTDFLSSVLLTMVVGRETVGSRAQTIRDVLTLALDAFFADEKIQQRHRQASEAGFESEAWRAIPTLQDFPRFCKAAHLGLGDKPGREVEEALNKIQLRLRSWLSSRVGQAISAPSSFRTDSHLLVFALRGLSNNEDAAVLALSAYAAALRRALSHEASIFFIDEAPILFEFDEIAALIGRLCANGAKQGIRVILTGQDPDTIAASAAGSKILQNLNTRLIGRIQPTAVDSFERIFRYSPELVGRNASESFFPNPQGVYSNWLLDDNGRFYSCRFYPSYVLLALTANNPDEKSSRAQVLAAFDDPYEGVAEFAKLLKHSIQSGTSIKTVVEEWRKSRPMDTAQVH